MTSELVLDIARAHLAASVLILVVLAVRKPARRLVGPRIAYALWLLPLIAALAMLAPPRIDYRTAPMAAPAPVIQTVTAFALPQTFEPAAAPAPVPPIDPWRAALVLWALGVGGSLGWLLIQQIRYLAFVRKGAAGPAVVGFWRPKVVLPTDFEDRYSAQERALILAHEQTHLTRQDPRVIGLALTLRSLAWFNPLAYIAVTKLRIDQELACDETVVSAFPRSRRAYADALAKSQLAIRPLPLGCYWPSGTEHPLLERLSMLKSSRIGTRGRLAGAGALTLLCAATGLAAWAAAPAQVRFVSTPAAALVAGPALQAPPVTLEPAQPAPATQLALLQPAPAPAASSAAPPLPNLSSGMQATVNTDRPVTFSGTIEKMEWVNPSSVITFRDASGDTRRVITDSPNTLIRGGADRNLMTIGGTISGQGYASKDGAMLFAAPTAMAVNGTSMSNDPAGYAREQELRKTLCAGAPPLPPNATPDDFRANSDRMRECEAKVAEGLANRGPASAPAAVPAITTNSIIRPGGQ